ncbi:hypothetical protein C8J56DRAFT_887768 [Mycena floridula]|nr:hypothetical protein C8J56DRAFT_887768 [Mycena floridula]
MPPKAKGSRVRIPSTQAARNNAIGSDTKHFSEENEPVSPSPELSPAKKKRRIRTVSNAIIDSDMEKADDDAFVPVVTNVQPHSLPEVGQHSDKEESGSQYDPADVDGVNAAWAESDDAGGVAASDEEHIDEVQAAMPSVPAKKKKAKKSHAKKEKQKSFPLPQLSDDDDLPDPNDIPFVTDSGVKVVSKPMCYEGCLNFLQSHTQSNTPSRTKGTKRSEVIMLSSGDEGPDSKSPVTSEAKGKARKMDPASDVEFLNPKATTPVKFKADGPPSEIKPAIGASVMRTPVRKGASTVSVASSPKTPSGPRLDRTALQAVMMSLFKKPIAVSSADAGSSGVVVVYDDLYQHEPSFTYVPSTIYAISLDAMMLHYDEFFHRDIKMAALPVLPDNVIFADYAHNFVDGAPKDLNKMMDLYGEVDAGPMVDLMNFRYHANYINPALINPLHCDWNGGKLVRVVNGNPSNRAVHCLSVGFAIRSHFLAGVQGKTDKLKHAFIMSFISFDMYRIKGIFSIWTGEDEICVQNVDIDGETFISMDTYGIEATDTKASSYKWKRNVKPLPKDRVFYTDIVPIFDLRAGFDVNKDLDNVFKFPIWPHPEVHAGAVVVTAYTIGKWVRNQRTFIGFNLLWIGVLHGDETLNNKSCYMFAIGYWLKSCEVLIIWISGIFAEYCFPVNNLIYLTYFSWSFDLYCSDPMVFTSSGLTNHRALVDAQPSGFHANLGSHQPLSEPRYLCVMVYAQPESSYAIQWSHQPPSARHRYHRKSYSKSHMTLPSLISWLILGGLCKAWYLMWWLSSGIFGPIDMGGSELANPTTRRFSHIGGGGGNSFKGSELAPFTSGRAVQALTLYKATLVVSIHRLPSIDDSDVLCDIPLNSNLMSRLLIEHLSLLLAFHGVLVPSHTPKKCLYYICSSGSKDKIQVQLEKRQTVFGD